MKKRLAASNTQVKKRRFITLIEILIVVGIIALVSGLATIGIRKALRDQKFRTEAYQVLTTLRLAQQLMIVLNTDVHVKFKRTDEGFNYRIELDDKLSERWHKELTRNRPLLKEIHAINFKDALEGGEGPLDIRFLSGGTVMSQGVMRLGTAAPGSPGALETFICLPGFPHFLQTTSSPQEDVACDAAVQRKYDQAVTQVTVAEVNEKNSQFKDTETEEKPKNDKKESQAAPKKS